ncbi:dihydroorotate dehydrogenase [Halioglobus japonicus]|uniref:dihydrouracil dehydrogenase (NAD(+)) n=1 Tax=Halioglobus japonicus TaxID=930805 RepID=A0AAP8MD59_9GAMM|nr:tRNA-dihydrouridine synthase [Halioglobus japonicus]AQA17694.1 dihydroorotate dehydrogenase [Halioglobus japonicus]PLW85643.1 dihydroorotate dehydrogenase [Halioglobus japonicus]GHD16717.1 dihydroorotate dehydrogenase [Halioglobus japonicus]
MSIEFFGKTLSGPFTVPSGIVTTAAPIMQYFFDNIPEVGVITTKSIGPEPRLGYREPVLSQYAPGCFVNAVGLTNAGPAASAESLAKLNVPEDRFLLTSIFGGSVEEFVEVAKILAPVSDGLELNLSCPHAKGYGMAMGQDPEMVKAIVSAVKAAVDIPVVAKLTPNTPDIGAIAKAAEAGGADGLCAINTVGPGYTSAHGHPVLSNGAGGMSGKGALPIALKCVREIRAVTDLPIIGCGGISSADDVRAFQQAGADVIGVGSALVGLTTQEIDDYFKAVTADLESGNNRAETHIRYDVDMNFKPVTLMKNEKVCDDITIMTFDRKINVQAGEFVFLWVPGIGEKPFSALTDDPFSLVIIDVGEFTHAMLDLDIGTECYVRGPHGIPVDPAEDQKIMAVAGGTGLAAVYQIARDFGNAEVFAGARTAERLYFLEECKQIADVHVATDDGSAGFQGVVTELLRERLQEMSAEERDKLVFYNCGPEPMVLAAIAVQKEFCRDDQIFSAIDYLTKCGVGICGACAAPDGRRLCVDGPFLVEGAPALAS